MFLLQFVADGVFKAELNEFLTRELAEDGYSGVEVRVTPTRTEIIIMATRTQNVLGEKGRRIRELTVSSTKVIRKLGKVIKIKLDFPLIYINFERILLKYRPWFKSVLNFLKTQLNYTPKRLQPEACVQLLKLNH